MAEKKTKETDQPMTTEAEPSVALAPDGGPALGTPERKKWDNEYVTVDLFKDSDKYKDDVFVAVNGQSCVIKRGQPVKVKRKFALVLEQSKLQGDKTAALIAEASARRNQVIASI